MHDLDDSVIALQTHHMQEEKHLLYVGYHTKDNIDHLAHYSHQSPYLKVLKSIREIKYYRIN